VEGRRIEGGDREMLGFETLTFSPIDLRLVEPAIMTADEIKWLDDYHGEVRRRLAADLDAETRAWLENATRPIG
jgi:Xaa-Pro aminopeptidase